MKNLVALIKSTIPKLMVALIGILLWTSINLFAQTVPDFSGTWNLDTLKSTPIPGIQSSTLIITQDGNKIFINSTLKAKDQKPLTRKTDYLVGGSFATKSAENSNSRKIETSWGPNKDSFKIIETMTIVKDGIKQVSQRTTLYSLKDQEKTLNIVADDSIPPSKSIPNGKMHSVMIYKK